MTTFTPIVMRHAHTEDIPAVQRLAQLDSSYAPGGEVLLAFEGAELRAAISATSGHVVADPFVPTAQVVELLRARVNQRPSRTRAARTRRLRPALA